jgi:hypothetical protein
MRRTSASAHARSRLAIAWESDLPSASTAATSQINLATATGPVAATDALLLPTTEQEG